MDVKAPSMRPERPADAGGRENAAWWERPAWRDAGLLLLLVAVVYGQVLRNEFIWDDIVFVLNNSFLQDLKNIPRMLLSPDAEGTGGGNPYYRPVTTMTFALDWFVYGPNPAGFHATNLLIHAATVLSLHALLRLGAGRTASFLGAAFFAVHPAHAEPVGYVSARGDLLCGFFVALSLYFYLRHLKDGLPRQRTFSVAAAALAVFSKIVGLVVPPLIALHLLLARRGRKGVLGYLQPYLLVALAFLILRQLVVVMDLWGSDAPLTHRLATSGIILATYVRNTLAPFWLEPQYFLAINGSLLEADVLAAWGLFFATAGLLFWAGWRRRSLLPGIALYFGALLPVSGIPALLWPNFVADRYLYVPLLGAAWALAAWTDDLLGKVSQARRQQLLATLGVALIVFATVAALRLPTWRDRFTYWNRVRELAPYDGGTQRNFALTSMEMGHFDLAEEALNKLLQLHYRQEDYLGDMAYLRLLQGRTEEAWAFIVQCVNRDPNNLDRRVTLAYVAGAIGNLDAARESVAFVLARRPDHRGALGVPKWLEVKYGVKW